MRLAARTLRSRTVMAAILALAVAIAVGAALLELALRFNPIGPAPYLAATPSPTLLDRDGALLHAALNPDDNWCFPKPADSHGAYLRLATIAAEDQRFYDHGGVDPFAVVRAALQYIWNGRIVSGASTITMQVVKLEDDSPRSLRGKIVQAWDALRLERAASKDQILTAYLNRAPYGYNLIGAEAASRRYFGKSSRELTLSEATLLAALPKAPGRLNPLEHPSAAEARRRYVLGRMTAEKCITWDQYAAAVKRPPRADWHEIPRDAAHIAGRCQTIETRTTLDGSAQRSVQTLLKRYLRQYDSEITNAAAIAIDVETAEILVYCGSADFFESPGGQIDLARAARSPGSALKPFVYAAAMQANRLYPSEILFDAPLDYGDYAPANYDGGYNGLIPAADALRYSLNVPAVQTLDRVGVSRAFELLQSLELTTLDNGPEHYGLGLVLGNCEVQLAELARAYLAVAAMGRVLEPGHVQGGRPGRPSRVFDPDIAAALFEMLRQPLPREFSAEYVRAGTGPTPVAWKTGTSTGHHDAWAFVFNRHYVVGVWVGNADRRASERIVGSDAALPIAAHIFRKLPPKSSAAWPEPSEHFRTVPVCALTGLPRHAHCPNTRRTPLPTSMYVNRRCAVHREAARDEGPTERWPAQARHWNLASVRRAVPLAKTNGAVEARLEILSPADRAEFILTGAPGGDRIRLRSSLDGDQPVHWYSDGRYLGKSEPLHPIFLQLSEGEQRIACMVGAGETDSVHIRAVSPETE